MKAVRLERTGGLIWTKWLTYFGGGSKNRINMPYLFFTKLIVKLLGGGGGVL